MLRVHGISASPRGVSMHGWQRRGTGPLALLAATLALILGSCSPSSERSPGHVPVVGQSSRLVTVGWELPASLGLARGGHTTTLLPSGRVLVVGGQGSSGTQASAELYAPATNSWASTGSLAQAREHHTATLLPSGQVLVVGGQGANGPLTSAELYDVATGTWTATGSLSEARGSHTVTLLPSGQVLVVGGQGANGPLTSAELYDVATGTWTATGSLSEARSGATATLLPSGRLLVAGGSGPSGALASAEVYDVATGSWTATGALSGARSGATATLLPSGKVLVAGGSGPSGALASAEVYDVATGSWTAALALFQARALHTATLLPSGKVLVAGGQGALGALTSAELYDPGAGSWAVTSSFTTSRYNAAATLLPSGKVLVIGGTDDYYGPLRSAQVYDPATGSWTATGSLTESRSYPTATLLPSGKVLVVGGYVGSNEPYRTSAELYDPATGTWTVTGSLAQGRFTHTATLLPSGKVLVVGGFSNGSTPTGAEVYDPATGTWAATGSPTQTRYLHTATLLPSGKVLVVSSPGYGHGGGLLNATAEVYDPATGFWTAAAPLSHGHRYHTATLLPSGKVLVVGGHGSSAASKASAELYDPATDSWTATGSLIQGRWEHTATLLLSGKVLVVGGRDAPAFDSAELYDPATGTWTATSTMSQPRLYHMATLLPSGRVLVTGGQGSASSYTSAEVYDDTGAHPTWRPVIAGVSASVPLTPGGAFTVNGSLLRGVSEASGGNSRSSPTDFPFLTLLDMARGRLVVLPSQDFSSTQVSSSVPLAPPGKHLLSLTVNGVTSSTVLDIAAVPNTVPPTVELTAPAEGATLNGTVLLSAAVADNVAVSRVEFYAGATRVGTQGAPPFNFSWNTRSVANSAHVLTAKAYDAAGQSATSSGVSVMVDNDLIAPTVAISAPTAGATVLNTVTVTAEAADNLGIASVQLYEGSTLVGTDTSSPYSFTWNTRTGPNAERTLTAKAYDAAGNTAVATVTVTVDNDFTPPTVALTTPGSGETLSGMTVLTATASDPSGIARVVFHVEYYHQVCIVSTAPYSCSFNTRNIPNGSRTIRVEAYDAVNNQGTAVPVTVTFDNDLTPPTVEFTSPATGATLKGNVALTATASDPSGISRVEFFVDYNRVGTATTAPYSFSYNTRSLPNGAQSLWARAFDTLGNDSQTERVYVTFNNDFIPPTVTLTAPAAGATLKGTVSLSATGTDNVAVSRVEFYDGATLLGTDTAPPFSLSWATRTAANGAHVLSAKAYDAAEQSATSPGVSVTLDNDLTGPTVAISAPAAGATVVGTLTVTATATDTLGVSRVELYEGSTLLGSDTSSPYTFTWNTRTGPNGARTLTAKATDTSGNISTSEVTVTANNDFTPPTVTLTAPGEGMTVSGNVLFTATASDNLAVTKVAFFVGTTQVGSDSTAPYSVSYNTRNLANGAKVLTAKAYDAVNNVGTSAPVNVTFDNDFTLPTVTLTAPGEGETLTGTVLLTATASDPAGISRVAFFVGTTLVGTDTTAPYSFSYNTRGLANGAKVLTAKAYDSLSNVGTSTPVNVTFDNDLTPPTVTLTAPGAGQTLSGTVLFTAEASDPAGIARVAFFVGTTLVGTDTTAPYSFSYNTRSLANGAKVLTAKAYDSLNNVGTSAPVNVTFDNDLTAPTTSLTSPASGATLTGMVQLDAIASDDRGSVAKVDFYQGAVLLGTVTTAPYSWLWDTTKVATGTTTLKTRAWDGAGNSAYGTAVSVTVAR